MSDDGMGPLDNFAVAVLIIAIVFIFLFALRH